jgi:hypothetical protein
MVVHIIGEKREEAQPRLIERSIDSYSSVSNSINPLNLGNFSDQYKQRQQERYVSYPREGAFEINDALGCAVAAEESLKPASRKEPVNHKYIKTPDISDGWVLSKGGIYYDKRSEEKKIWSPGNAGGAAPPGGNYFQAGLAGQTGQAVQNPYSQEFISSMFGGLLSEIAFGAKDAIFRSMVEWPMLLRDTLMRKINSMGKLMDYLSSLYTMGADAGAIQRMVDDLRYDRLQLITNEKNELLGVRTYNERPVTDFIKWLRKERMERGEPIIPRMGRPLESVDDLKITREGHVAAYNEGRIGISKRVPLGGLPLTDAEIIYDGFFTESRTLWLATHGEIDEPGISTEQLEKNLIQFILSHYIYSIGRAEKKQLGPPVKLEDGRETTFYSITLPHGYGLGQWDSQLFQKTLSRVIGAALITHLPYYAFEKIYQRIPEHLRGKKNYITQREVDTIFLTLQPYISRIARA